jgi:hypothetical protein
MLTQHQSTQMLAEPNRVMRLGTKSPNEPTLVVPRVRGQTSTAVPSCDAVHPDAASRRSLSLRGGARAASSGSTAVHSLTDSLPPDGMPSVARPWHSHRLAAETGVAETYSNPNADQSGS